jgi:hypothetical protein
MSKKASLAFTLCTLVTLIVTSILLPLALQCTGFFPWSQLNCTRHEIDIYTGRTRVIRYLYFVPLVCQVRESTISRAAGYDAYDDTTATWRPYRTLSPGQTSSPTQSFDSVTTQMDDVDNAWAIGQFSDDARRVSARRILSLWQSSGQAVGADQYIARLQELAWRQLENGNLKTDVSELPH